MINALAFGIGRAYMRVMALCPYNFCPWIKLSLQYGAKPILYNCTATLLKHVTSKKTHGVDGHKSLQYIPSTCNSVNLNNPSCPTFLLYLEGAAEATSSISLLVRLCEMGFKNTLPNKI